MSFQYCENIARCFFTEFLKYKNHSASADIVCLRPQSSRWEEGRLPVIWECRVQPADTLARPHRSALCPWRCFVRHLSHVHSSSVAHCALGWVSHPVIITCFILSSWIFSGKITYFINIIKSLLSQTFLLQYCNTWKLNRWHCQSVFHTIIQKYY